VKRFVIEREMPAVGTLEREQMRAAAEKSNSVLRELGPEIQWVESHVTQDKIYCVYLARDAALIRKHAEMSGFPANRISEVKRTIDPTTARRRHRLRFYKSKGPGLESPGPLPFMVSTSERPTSSGELFARAH
jgi:hypothetical protein